MMPYTQDTVTWDKQVNNLPCYCLVSKQINQSQWRSDNDILRIAEYFGFKNYAMFIKKVFSDSKNKIHWSMILPASSNKSPLAKHEERNLMQKNAKPPHVCNQILLIRNKFMKPHIQEASRSTHPMYNNSIKTLRNSQCRTHAQNLHIRSPSHATQNVTVYVYQQDRNLYWSGMRNYMPVTPNIPQSIPINVRTSVQTTFPYTKIRHLTLLLPTTLQDSQELCRGDFGPLVIYPYRFTNLNRKQIQINNNKTLTVENQNAQGSDPPTTLFLV